MNINAGANSSVTWRRTYRLALHQRPNLFLGSSHFSSTPWAEPSRWLDFLSVAAFDRRFGVPELPMIWRKHIVYVRESVVLSIEENKNASFKIQGQDTPL